jgi:hypothetical protein
MLHKIRRRDGQLEIRRPDGWGGRKRDFQGFFSKIQKNILFYNVE